MNSVALLIADSWFIGIIKMAVVATPNGMAAHCINGMRRPRGFFEASDFPPIHGSRNASIRRPLAVIAPIVVSPKTIAPCVMKMGIPWFCRSWLG